MKFLIAAALLAASLLSAGPVQADDTVDKLQSLSVTIKSGHGQGSGVLFTRQLENGKTVTYVWTAAHVVDNLRKTREVIVNGSPKTVVEFEDAQIVQEYKQDGRRIGELKMEARVVRFSDAQQGEDLALLEVRKRDFTKADETIEFYKGEIPNIGTELYHVGSLLGQFGANSLTTGVVSQVGRVLDLGANGVVFDQTTVTAFPGSSGGGVFLKSNGQYMGMLVRGAGEQFNLIVPVRRLRDWAKTAKVEWAIDQSVALPSDEELKKLPVEDAGVSFGAGYNNARPATETNLKFPFRMNFDNLTPPSSFEPIPDPISINSPA